ncbi:MAG TPA: RNA polymerase sigma factor [Candidatus Eisenbacteria bacterium]|nr:RNA polymerase sigma factor [Candidatus Eisenbacteria bacterium]
MNDDQAWFEQRVRTLGRPAMKYANVLVHDMNLAEEIVQEAFARAWASPTTPSVEVEFRSYLYRIIANLAHDYYRRQSRRAMLNPQGPVLMDPQEMAERRAADDAMKRGLTILGLRERQAVYLRYFEDLSVAETARIMGSRQGTVRVIVYRALRKLKRHLSTNEVSDVVAIR